MSITATTDDTEIDRLFPTSLSQPTTSEADRKRLQSLRHELQVAQSWSRVLRKGHRRRYFMRYGLWCRLLVCSSLRVLLSSVLPSLQRLLWCLRDIIQAFVTGCRDGSFKPLTLDAPGTTRWLLCRKTLSLIWRETWAAHSGHPGLIQACRDQWLRCTPAIATANERIRLSRRLIRSADKQMAPLRQELDHLETRLRHEQNQRQAAAAQARQLASRRPELRPTTPSQAAARPVRHARYRARRLALLALSLLMVIGLAMPILSSLKGHGKASAARADVPATQPLAPASVPAAVQAASQANELPAKWLPPAIAAYAPMIQAAAHNPALAIPTTGGSFTVLSTRMDSATNQVDPSFAWMLYAIVLFGSNGNASYNHAGHIGVAGLTKSEADEALAVYKQHYGVDLPYNPTGPTAQESINLAAFRLNLMAYQALTLNQKSHQYEDAAKQDPKVAVILEMSDLGKLWAFQSGSAVQADYAYAFILFSQDWHNATSTSLQQPRVSGLIP